MDGYPLNGVAQHNHNAADEDEYYGRMSREQLIEEIKILKKIQHQTSESKIDPPQQREKNPMRPSISGERNELVVDSKALKEKKKKKSKEMNFQDHSQRKIALTISYEGSEHGGLAWQPEITRLSTVEGELFRALLIGRLVDRKRTGEEDDGPVDFNDPTELIRSVDLERWGYSRAGRTDAGVSGAGQVVSLWVRSRLKSAPSRFGFRPKPSDVPGGSPSDCPEEHEPIEEELEYHTTLNSLLPPSVRVLAWSPVSKLFDARFSCQARHYKYFFSLYENPAGPPLDIDLMRLGAAKLLGEHDFRNFCRIDPSKQINNFRRKILLADINPVHPHQPTPSTSTAPDDGFVAAHRGQSNPMYVLDLIGTAFLYNMVRHIVAVLFLIGSRLEGVEVLERMFSTEGGVESKPIYEHASGLPLLFYRSIYAERTFEWRGGGPRGMGADVFVRWSRDRLREMLSLHQLAAHDALLPPRPPVDRPAAHPLGAALLRPCTRYVPLLERPRAPHFSLVNANWWLKTGAKKLANRQLLGRS